MTIIEKILAALQTKFPGVETAILTRIANKKGEGVTDENAVDSIVEGIGFPRRVDILWRLPRRGCTYHSHTWL